MSFGVASATSLRLRSLACQKSFSRAFDLAKWPPWFLNGFSVLLVEFGIGHGSLQLVAPSIYDFAEREGNAEHAPDDAIS